MKFLWWKAKPGTDTVKTLDDAQIEALYREYLRKKEAAEKKNIAYNFLDYQVTTTTSENSVKNRLNPFRLDVLRLYG